MIEQRQHVVVRAFWADIVVLVEDHEDTRELTREFLELEGYAVVAYGDGESALRALRRMPVRPSLVILDVRLPGMSGKSLLRELHDDPALASVPVLLTTAGSYETVAPLRIPYLLKPFDPDVLLRAVRRYARPLRASSAGDA
jgi:DNA-binding response OmpR family regulator